MEKQRLVGLAVGWLNEGRLIFTKGYGLADREEKIPVSSDTVFNWASNSKKLLIISKTSKNNNQTSRTKVRTPPTSRWAPSRTASRIGPTLTLTLTFDLLGDSGI